MNINTSKKINFYTQGQRFAARMLCIVWLLVNGSPENALAGGPAMAILSPTTMHSPRLLVVSSIPPPVSLIGDEAASSTAAPTTLQELMSQESVPNDNEILVSALNAAPLKEQRQWILAAIQWFITQPSEALTPAAIRDYAALARVTPKHKTLLNYYFNSLCDKVQGGSYGEELFLQALAYALAHIDPTIFEVDPQPLLDLGTNLLAKLNPRQHELKQADYTRIHASLDTIFQTLLLAMEIVPTLNIQAGEGLYQSFKSRLQKIADQVQYYPVIYQARILKQTLQLLEDPNINQQGNFRRLGQWLLRADNMEELATDDLNLTEFQQNITLLKQAEQCIQTEPWYSQLLSLEEAMFQCFERQSLIYPYSEQLDRYSRDLTCRKRDRVAAVLGSDKINQDKQAFRFGIAMQLRTLALQGPTPAIRTGSITRLTALTQQTSWESDAAVMAGLLDSLALVATQNQAEREQEADMARGSLENLAAKPPSDASGYSGILGRLLHFPFLQDTSSKAFSAWLAQKTLNTKLQHLQEQTTQQAPSDEETPDKPR